MGNSVSVYPYLVDPFRLGEVYGSGDLEIERAVWASSNWPPADQDTSLDADHALDEIIRGAELVAQRRALYTRVLEHVCAALGVTASRHCEHDDPELLAGDIVHFVNEGLGRLGAPLLMPVAYPDHPFLPGLPLTLGMPMVEVYAAADCARTRLVLKARWSELSADDRAACTPMLRLLEKRRLHDALVLFSY